jgi:hypothetical protein
VNILAITLEAAASGLVLGGIFKSTTGDEAVKRTLLNGAADDSAIIQLLQDMDDLSNAKMMKWKWGGRKATGFDSSASTNSQNLVSAFMQLNFSQVDPVNADNTVERHWTLPAYVDTLRGSDNLPQVASPGSGSVAAKLGRIIAFLEDNLAFEASDGSIVVGGFTYIGGGFGTGADFIDGE